MNISFSKLKKLLFESIDNKFKVGCKYKWWSRNRMWSGFEFIVVEIAPDRSYLFEVSTTGKNLGAKKFKIIKDENGGEKISDHPAAYTWRVARADKGGEFVGVPEGWYSEETANRKEGAAKANKTRSINSLMKRIANKITKEQFFSLMALRFKNDFGSWKDVEKYYQEHNIDGELVRNPRIMRSRGPRTAKGKTVYMVFVGLAKGHQMQIGYDGERYYADWDSFSDGLTDEEVREVLSNIIE